MCHELSFKSFLENRPMSKILASLAVLMMSAGTAFAQVGQQQTPQADQQRQADQRQQGQLGQRDRATRDGRRATATRDGDLSTGMGDAMRASQAIGMGGFKVHTRDGESIGNVDDLVFDLESGEIRYAAVSVGGFLGIGDTLVAVPWKAFDRQRDDSDNVVLVLDTTKDQLENAPGFDSNNWPAFADPQWQAQNDRHYETRQDRAGEGQQRR